MMEKVEFIEGGDLYERGKSLHARADYRTR